MKGIINAFSTLINMIKMLFGFIMDFFSTIGMVFKYLITIVNMAFNVIVTFPPWIKAFATITISICIAYFVIGRNAGKSD